MTMDRNTELGGKIAAAIEGTGFSLDTIVHIANVSAQQRDKDRFCKFFARKKHLISGLVERGLSEEEAINFVSPDRSETSAPLFRISTDDVTRIISGEIHEDDAKTLVELCSTIERFKPRNSPESLTIDSLEMAGFLVRDSGTVIH